MKLKEDTQDALRALQISDLPEDWVSSLWDGNFCQEAVSLPIHAVEEEALLNEEGWELLVETCSQWPQEIKRKDYDGAGFWTTLMEVGVSYKCILALVYTLMERPKQRAVDRICAVQASRLYITLLQLPGTGGHKLFHPMIFQKAINVFHLYPNRGGRAKSAGRRSLKGSKKGRRGKRRRKGDMVDEEGDEEEEMAAGGEESVMETGGEDTVLYLLKKLMTSLYKCLSQHSLADQDVSRYQLIQAVLHMTRKEMTSSVPLVLNGAPDAGQDCPVGQGAPMFVLAWTCLDALCQRLHGSIEKITSEVFRQLLPSLLMLTEDGGYMTVTPLPSSLSTLSRNALSFVEHMTRGSPVQVHVPLLKLIQHICTKIPDRAEYRSKMAVLVSQLLGLLPTERYSEMMDWLHKFSRNTKIGFRVFALDLVNELLSQPLRQATADLSEEGRFRLSYKFLVRVILSRCPDKAPSVRSRALTCLASAAASKTEELVEAVRNAVFPQTTSDPNSKSLIVAMVHRRTTDEKVGVRKAGLQALESIMRMDGADTRSSDVAVLHERCLDPALSVRKQAITSLTSLLMDRKKDPKLHSFWLEGVLPMVMDKEVGGEEKCLQVMQEVLLSNITPLDRSTETDSESLAWHLLSLVAEDDRVDLQRYLRRALDQWSRAGSLTSSLVSDVCSHVQDKDHMKAAWMLLSEMSQFYKSIDTKFLYDHWMRQKEAVTRETSSPLVQILVVIGNHAASVSHIAIQDIQDDIIQLLMGFQLGPPVIQAAVNTLCLICAALNTKHKYQSSLDSWCVPLLQACESYITALLQDNGKELQNQEHADVEICTYLFTLGEVAQLCPSHTSHHLCLMVQSILLASSETTPSATPIPSSQTSGSDAGEFPSSQGSSQGEGFPSSQSSMAFLSGLQKDSLSPSLRAHAYVTLGKLCLQNEPLAKKCVVQLARELLVSRHPSIRNNIVIILCDLAVRYSTKVDPYISSISSCLKDTSYLVRKQTLTLLARLLQEDYIKWRGSLFFHFISALVDPELNHFAEFCLEHLLLVRHPGMFYQHFVECIFFFNSYEKHKVYNQFKQTDREKNLFSLKGKKNAEKRLTIYTFLLSNMTDEHRFQLTAKLCQEVIGGLLDGAIPLDDEGVDIVKDTLAILASKEIKLTSLRRNIGEDLADEGDQVGAAVAKAQTKIISQLVKRNVMENVVPTVIAAKHLFEKEHNPLLKDLLLYLKELMQDYRNEIGEVLAGDPQLVQEIQFDLKRFDEEQRRAAQARPTSITPHAMMASPLLSPGALGPVATATVMATPPKMKNSASPATTLRKRKSPAPPPAKTPLRLPLALSPLVVVQRVANTSKLHPPADFRTPLATTASKGGGRVPAREPLQERAIQDAETAEEGDVDVSSPEAARARTSAINQNYKDIQTPVSSMRYGGVAMRTPAAMATQGPVRRVRRSPSIPLQRAVLLSTVRKKQRQLQHQCLEEQQAAGEGAGSKTGPQEPDTVPAALPSPAPGYSEETLEGERLTSTPGPEGLAEALSFNVTALLPPTPIPPSSALRFPPGHIRPGKNLPAAKPAKPSKDKKVKEKRRSKRLKVAEEAEVGAKKPADIFMTSPDAESKPLPKWRVKLT